jgi:PIN domain nuclease of toxin-antitoxin system
MAAAGLAAVVVGFWLGSATKSATEISAVAAPTPVSQVSIWEIHNQAHLEFLPVQQFDDYSLVFTENEPISSERR